MNECLRDHRGRRRERPEVHLPEDRPQNDYDNLLDTRAYSPNNRTRGFWDWDPATIESENAFAAKEELLSPSPSPIPEPSSLEAMMYTSLREPSPGLPSIPLFIISPDEPSDHSIRSYEVAQFATRFRALSERLQALIIVEQRRNERG